MTSPDLKPCECINMCLPEGPESMGMHHNKMCPEYKAKKYPYLFYYEEAVDSWIPAPDKTEHIIATEDQLEDGEKIEIEFKRVDMTDDEYDSMPVE